MTHQICDACECVSHCRKNGCIPVTPMPEKPALPLSTSVTSLQLELSVALEMAVRDRMLVKELALDAARYRWLRNEAHPDREDTGIAVSERDFNDWGNAFTRHYSGEKLDDAIDAALSRVPK